MSGIVWMATEDAKLEENSVWDLCKRHSKRSDATNIDLMQ